MGLTLVAADLRSAGLCVEGFQSGSLAGFQGDLELWSKILKDMDRARTLPEQEMRAKFREFLPTAEGLKTRFEKSSGEALLFKSFLEGCGQGLEQAGEMIRKGSIPEER